MIKIVNAVGWVAAIGVAASLAIVMPAFAQTNVGVGASVGVNVQGGIHNGANGVARFPGAPGSGIFGKVSAVNGTTLTVTAGGAMTMRPLPMRQMASSTSGMPMMPVMATTTYSVDASNATVYKGSATTTVSLSAVAVGDSVFVQGNVSGTNVTATVIRDGFPRPMSGPTMPGGGRRFMQGNGSSTPSGTPFIQGNGEPVIGGKVTAASGTTITVTNASNVTYTINAASTTVIKNGTSTAIGNIAIGDNLIVQGTVNGNSVTASSIIDQGAKVSPSNASSTSNAHGGVGFGLGGGLGGFFGAIGGFFQHLFGF